MNKEELDEIYYELQNIQAILWMFSNMNDDAQVNMNVSIVAGHYQELLEEIMKKIAKCL